MAKEMLINVSAGEECRIALLNDGKLEELYMERTSATSHVGNIYKGKVTNVEPSIQAAFVDFGIGRNGFLHISDLMPSYFGKKNGGDVIEPVGRKLGRRDRPPIQQCLRKGDEIIVQIIKEGIGTKGPTLSTYLSIPGRVLVMMPGMSKMGISKKLEDEDERSRLRKILDGLKPPKDCGFIIRTAGIGKSKMEIERDLKYLARLWEQLKKKIDKEKPPVELYTEGDLVTRTVRDVFTSDVDRIIIDDEETAKKVKDFIKLAMPRTKNKVDLYDETLPLFHKYDIENEIESIYSRRVALPSGGSLVIDQTEAVVAIDVNSGKFRDHSDAETTAFKTDLEAADEIPRQLKLRDMGGVIICDFIDLRFDRHRRELEERLHNNLKNDRAKTRMLRMSQFGIVEMTRQRMRPSLKKSIYQECHSCRAHGMVKTPESMSLDVTRKLRIAAADLAVVRILVGVHPEVASFMLNRKRAEIATLEDETQKRVIITADTSLPMDEVKFELYDARDGYIYIAELGMAFPQQHQQSQQTKPTGRDRGRDRDRNRSQQIKPKHDQHHEETESIDAEDLFTDESDTPKKPATPKAVPTRKGAIEQTGDEDEASVVEIDEGGTELPGNAPDSFMEPGERDRYHDRNRRGGRDFRNNRNNNQRSGQSSQPPQQHRDDDDDGDADSDDSSVENEPSQEDRQSRDNRPQRDNRYQNDNRQRDNRQRDDRQRDDRPRDDRPRDNRSRSNRSNENRPNDNRPSDNRPRENVQQDNRQPQRNAPNTNASTPQDGDADQGVTGEGQVRRRRRRRGRRGRGRGTGGPVLDANGNPMPDQSPRRDQASQPIQADLANDDVDFDDTEHDVPAPGNELGDHNTPQAQLQLRDERAAKDTGRGGRRRRGGRGRGRGRNGKNEPQRPAFDRTGLPDDEELEREAAELEARQAQLSAEAETAQPIDEMDDDDDDSPELSPEELSTPPVEPAPALMDESTESKPARAKAAPRTRRGGAKRVPPPQPDVVKTGSTDKHLVDDEPIDHEPIAQPSSYGDLDALPDFDDD